MIQTLGFSELIFWIYEKQFNPDADEIDEFYLALIDIIAEINSHPLFSDEIINEFNNNYSIIKDHERFKYQKD